MGSIIRSISFKNFYNFYGDYNDNIYPKIRNYHPIHD